MSYCHIYHIEVFFYESEHVLDGALLKMTEVRLIRPHVGDPLKKLNHAILNLVKQSKFFHKVVGYIT